MPLQTQKIRKLADPRAENVEGFLLFSVRTFTHYLFLLLLNQTTGACPELQLPHNCDTHFRLVSLASWKKDRESVLRG